MEERASGVEVEQMELDSLLEEILEREKDAKKELKATAEEVRKRAMERMAKPKIDDQENKQKKSKVRRSTADVIDYLRERSNNESECKKGELEVRKREIEVQAEKQDQACKQQQTMFSASMAQMQQQQSQQNLQALLVAQQQQQSKLLMEFMENNKR